MIGPSIKKPFDDREDTLALKIRSRLILWIGHLAKDRPSIETIIDEIDDLARDFVLESRKGTIEEAVSDLGTITKLLLNEADRGR